MGCGAGKRMAHFMGSNHRIDNIGRPGNAFLTKADYGNQ